MLVRRQLSLFFVAVACAAAGQSIFDATFSNYLADTFGISAMARGWMEFPRELPGFLTVATTGLLCAFAVTRVGMAAAVCMVLGFAGLGIFGDRYHAMIAMIVVSSIGMHLLMPVTDTISLTMADATRRGRRMGQVGMTQTVGQILGFGLVWLVFDRSAPQYRAGFLAGAVLALAAACIYGMMHLPHLHQARTPLVIRREYGLYYVLEFFAGARKQIFLTFGPWVLIKIYGMPASSIAGLLLVGALCGIFFKPAAGWLIDRFGERKVMVADGLFLALVCLGYGYALWLAGGDADWARRLASGCFIADNLLFALGSGRAIFLSRIARSDQELSATLAMGVSVNHIVSMSIPIAAGALWVWMGYEKLFLAAAVLAVVIAAIATRMPPLPRPAAPVPEPAEEAAVCRV